MINHKIALIAHDRRKDDLGEWVEYNAATLITNQLICTKTTGDVVENILFNYLNSRNIGLEWEALPFLTKVNSGPLGGDAQIAAKVAEGQIDLCIFLVDDLTANPHEADIQMLLRQCRIHNVPVACNRSTADHLLSSPLWHTSYQPSTSVYG